MKTSTSAVAVLLVVLLTGGVPRAAGEEPNEGVVAVVNGEPVYVQDLEQLLEQMHAGASAARRTGPDLDRLVFRLVNDTLLAQEARALGMDEEDPVPARMAARRESLAVARLEREEITSRAEPSDQEIEQAFADEYRTITFRILTVKEREKADALRRELEKGAGFAALARESSVDPYGPRGGLVENLSKIDMPLEIAADAFAMKPGEVKGPIATSIGWSDIRVESVAAADPKRLETVRPSVRALLRYRKAEALRADLAGRLRSTHEVAVDDAALAAIVPSRLPDGRLMPKVENGQAVVARVGDRAITAARLGQALGFRWKGVANEQAALAARGIVLDRLVQGELMAVEALARGYGDTKEAKRALHAAETQMLVSRYLKQVVGAEIRVTPEEAQAYYAAHKESFRRPPRLRLRQVTVATEAEARRLADLLRKGADIAWLARQHSTDGYKDAGGDRGWVTPRGTGEPLEAALLEAKPGDVLGPSPAATGFTVVQVGSREEQGTYDYKEVSGNVRRAVEEEKTQEAIHELVRKLRARSKIEVYEERIAALRMTASPVQDGAPSHAMPATSPEGQAPPKP